MSDLTRRQALQAGGTAAAAAIVFLHPWTGAVARAGDGTESVPRHLLRSSWRGLSDRELHAGDFTLRLESVSDLPAASEVAYLADSEDAFLLTFSGPKSVGAQDVPLRVKHAELGTFDIAIGPGGEHGRYYAVVNRVLDNRKSRVAPPRAARRAPSGEPPVVQSHDDAIRSVQAKRAKHGAKCVVELASADDITDVMAWLERDDSVVAAASRRVQRNRVAINLKGSKKRLRKGVYQLTVIALDADGEQHARHMRVRFR
jgi:hypothetical protein